MERKVVLVTGSSKGLGREIIRLFAEKGYDVVINYNTSKEDAFNLKDAIEKKYGVKALVVKCDVSDTSEVKEMMKNIMDTFSRLDVVVNNAAIEVNSTISNKTKEEFLRVLEVNLVGTFLVSKEASNIMRIGSVVNISSDNSIDKYDELTLEYDTSKIGINLLTKILARTFYPTIRVNAVAPGWILTDKILATNAYLDGKLLEGENFAGMREVANVVYFLASEEARHVNGEVIVVDGGS